MTDVHNGNDPVLWTLSEPFGAKDWWPCKQDLNDKIDNIDVYITAPSEYKSVSNGIEQSQQENEDGTTTTHFKHTYPIPAYLIAIAICEYTIYTQDAGTAPNEFQIVNYIYPEHFPALQETLDQTPPIMDLYEELFETYPFHEEKYGHAECNMGGAMEHTTVSFMGGFNRNIIAHELAHHWFGDKVTCGSWRDLWLNEGFATYVSGLVVEHLDGNDSFTTWKGASIDFIASLPDGSVYVPANDTLTYGRLFSNRLTYNKGGMVVHMLRFKLGDDDFFQGLRDYLDDEDLAYAYAKTPQLQAHLEEASGMDLTEFFNDWVYNEGYPTYTITAQNWDSGHAKITVSQTQSHPSVSYFEMPIPIRLTGPGGQIHDVIVENTTNGQEFIVEVPFVIDGALFDPERNIISAANTITLATGRFDLLAGITLYPNPANGTLNVKLPQAVVLEKAVFYNTLGQKVMETAGDTSWNVSKLSQGTYFVTLVSNEGSKQLRFIKE
jgi:aminopeptidase N